MSRQDTYPSPESPAELYDTITDICFNAEDNDIERERVREVLKCVRKEQFEVKQ